jgi:5-methylcytosine-specific restriction endonuclease McrA
MTTRDPRLWSRAYRNLCRYVLARDRNRCQIHGPRCTQYATEVDHVIARADGGDLFDPANLRAACRACNAGRGAQRTNERRYRDSVARYETRM